MNSRATLIEIVKQWAFWQGAADDTPERVADAYRAEVLREARDAVRERICEPVPGEAYPGELAMLRGLVRALRPAARDGDLPEVQRLLIANVRDEQGARENGARR